MTPAPTEAERLVDLDALAAVMREATEGPWVNEWDEHEGHAYVRTEDGPGAGSSGLVVGSNGGLDEYDAAAIVALRNAWPAIERELRALREVAVAARELASWDLSCLLVDHPDSETVVQDERRLDAALDRLDAMKGSDK